MHNGSINTWISKQRRTWRLKKLSQAFWAFILVLVTGLLWFLFVQSITWVFGIALFMGLVLSFFILLRNHFFKNPDPYIIHYFNLNYPELDYSTALLLKKDRLGPLERLQKQRCWKHLQGRPLGWERKSSFAYALWLSWLPLTALAAYFIPQSELDPSKTFVNGKKEASDKEVSLQWLNHALKVEAPAYTGIKSQSGTGVEWEVIEGSLGEFNAQWNQSPDSVFLYRNEEILETEIDLSKSYTFPKQKLISGVWKMEAYLEGKALEKEWLIKVKNDQRPSIQLINQNSYEKQDFHPSLSWEIQAEAYDDFGISQVNLTLTRSRGQGESVKFTEWKLPFENFSPGKATQTKLKAHFSVQSLDLKAGDELYLQAWVADSKRPTPQSNTSSTHFIILEDSSVREASFSVATPVDMMPEYFRSQRQIIIDTEKLIQEKSRLSKSDFSQKANEIGMDQKVLRLRYGMFLGEEFEDQSLDHHEHHYENDHHDHEHDHHHDHDHHDDHEHGSQKAKKQDHLHLHDHEEPLKGTENTPDQDGGKQAVIEAVGHIHDSQNVASFFDDALKAQMKEALAQMWQAELRLRTARPEEALSFEYKALSIIKDIQRQSRVYVQRMGFEPPPIKEAERRLQGDLEDIQAKGKNIHPFKGNNPLRSLQENLMALAHGKIQLEEFFTQTQRDYLSNSLTEALLEDPFRYKKLIYYYGQLIQGKILDSREIKDFSELLLALVEPNPQAKRSPQQHQNLSKSYWQELQPKATELP